jgi:hypothetical protein
MSHREWHESGGTAVVSPRTTEHPSGVRSSKDPDSPPMLSFEQVFPHLTSEQQQQLIQLAQHQGFLFPSQIPSPNTNGLVSNRQPSSNSTNLTQVRPEDLPRLPVLSPIPVFDNQLDVDQRDALARSLHTPDFLLVEGFSGTGKTRLVREILQQLSTKGNRVLFLCSKPSTLDELCLSLDDLLIHRLRLLDREERPDQLSTSISPFTLHHRERSLYDQLTSTARQNQSESRNRLERIRSLQEIWDQISQQIGERKKSLQEMNELTQRMAQIPNQVSSEEPFPNPDEVDSDSSQKLQSLQDQYRDQSQLLEAEYSTLEQKRIVCREQFSEIEKELESIHPLCQAKESGKWWSIAYWKAKLDNTISDRDRELHLKKLSLEQALAELEAIELDWKVRKQKIDEFHRQEIERFAEVEKERQKSELQIQLDGLQSGIEKIERNLQQKIAWIRETIDLPIGDFSDESLASARDLFLTKWKSQEEESRFAQNWFEFIQTEGETLVRQHRSHFNLVMGLIPSIHSDPFLNDPNIRSTLFDYLVIDEAEFLTESDFLTASRKSQKWVLVGQNSPEDTHPPERARQSHFQRASSGTRNSKRTRCDFFARLVHRFQYRPWFQQGKRFGCRLQQVRGEARKYLENEVVADNPQIELRIFTPPNEEPKLAEVVFSQSISPHLARQFLHKEVEETVPNWTHRVFEWKENGTELCIQIIGSESVERVPLSNGITELLSNNKTVGFAFDCAIWLRERAEAWVEELISLRDYGRVASLSIPHRVSTSLAVFLNDLFSYQYSLTQNGLLEPSIRFVKVPSNLPIRELPNPNSSDRRPVPPKSGGAGFEIDLSDTRKRAELPPAWHAHLPHYGYVNRLEAEKLLEWVDRVRKEYPTSSIGITALYSAQVALLRFLFARIPNSEQLRVIEPTEANALECDVLLVSLTRSHLSRAVTFSEEPDLLERILPLVRKQLIFFGDLGTIARRAQWDGPCDHFDPSASQRERDWIIMLLRYLNGTGPHASIFQVVEGEKA